MTIKKPIPIDVGGRIKSIRTFKGLSMDEFAKMIDDKAKSGTVANWETGKNLPNNARLKKIAEIGGVSVNYLLSGDIFAASNLVELANQGSVYGRTEEEKIRKQYIENLSAISLQDLDFKQIEILHRSLIFLNNTQNKKEAMVLYSELSQLINKFAYDKINISDKNKENAQNYLNQLIDKLEK
ncbi:helix-turn-helix transcriptional regulator [Vagococcus carniphilus]|uniref:helix-turn-helix domain-containing protein n=1 Tax=Vagococcus carniphilus TaxID=218144 RepID=UPI00288D55CB|nr:helix-turn-helix transcriptional regulator [Vagococcus carniphilus]MDT2849720.1 helix-turn-helix transcriptional regulator [Vagococcus carniphilus]